jgi:phosphatidate cytidylyltransferase
MSLRQRFPTAMILLAVLFVVVQYAPPFVILLALQALILAALIEFYGLGDKAGFKPEPAVGIVFVGLFAVAFAVPGFPLPLALFGGVLFAAFYFVVAVDSPVKLAGFPASFALTLIGPLYIAFTLDHLYLIRMERGPFYIYLLCAAIFMGDSGAFLFGSLLGRHKMTPTASPNKTWEGSLGGLLFAAVGAFAVWMVLLPGIPVGRAVLAGVLSHAVAQISDPLESLFKRAAGVKDSSHILPGHGGFLDRIDSLLLASPFFYYFVRYLWR